MADDRVLLGKRGSDYGLWVSKAGTDVTSTGLENMLFASNVQESGGSVLKLGSTTVVFSGTNATASSSDVYYNLDGSNGSLGFIPIVMFNRKTGNNLYPFNTMHSWETGDIAPPSGYEAYDSSASNGYQSDTVANIYATKFNLTCTRFIRASDDIDGLANGTHTFFYAVLGAGEASTTSYP